MEIKGRFEVSSSFGYYRVIFRTEPDYASTRAVIADFQIEAPMARLSADALARDLNYALTVFSEATLSRETGPKTGPDNL